METILVVSYIMSIIALTLSIAGLTLSCIIVYKRIKVSLFNWKLKNWKLKKYINTQRITSGRLKNLR